MKVDSILLLAGYSPPIIQSKVLEQEVPELQPFQSSDLGAVMFHLTAASVPVSSLGQRYNTRDDIDEDPEWRTSLAFFVDWQPIKSHHFGYLWCENVAQLQSTELLGFSLLGISAKAKRSAKGVELGTYEGQYWVVNINGATSSWDLLCSGGMFLPSER